MSQNWYAVYTKPQWEKKVASILKRKKFNSYCPLIAKPGIRKNVLQPLFPTYVFVQASAEAISSIKQVQGVINLVYWLNQPAVIKNNEIDIIKEFLDDYKEIRLEKTAVSMGDMVSLIGDATKIMGDQVVLIKNNTMKATLPSLGFSLIADVEYTEAKVIYGEIGMKRFVS